MVVASGIPALATIAGFVVTALRAEAGGAPALLGLVRGFVMGQLWGFTGDGWIAAVLSSVLFGFMHLYQGAWGVLRTGAIGFVFALGVLLTGSLVPSMIAHTSGNVLGAAFPPRRAATAAPVS
jgi:membrane protease YdiL (CAAX protease family)